LLAHSRVDWESSLSLSLSLSLSGARRLGCQLPSDLDFRHALSHMRMLGRDRLSRTYPKVVINAIFSLQDASRTVRTPSFDSTLIHQLMRHTACPSRRTTTSRIALPLLSTALDNLTSLETSSLAWSFLASSAESVCFLYLGLQEERVIDPAPQTHTLSRLLVRTTSATYPCPMLPYRPARLSVALRASQCRTPRNRRMLY
jgi:hypothetical protein